MQQGQWARCEACRDDIVQGTTCTAAAPSDLVGANHADAACEHCSKRTHWKQRLGADMHGCAACHCVFDRSEWAPTKIADHKRKNIDLVCGSCRTKGFSPGIYEKHLCTQCQEEFGTLQFDKDNLKDFKRQKTSKLVCKHCQSKLHCAACQGTFDAKEWSQ